MARNALMFQQFRDSERSERSSHGAILGLILLVVFGGLSLIPFGPAEAPVGPEGAWQERGYAIQVMCGGAALVGGFTVAVCLTLTANKRGLPLVVVGLVPVVIAMVGPDSRRLIFPDGAPSELWLGAVAWLGMVVGARVNLRRPGCRVGVLVGAVSAGAFLVLLIPLPLSAAGGWVSLWRTPGKLYHGGFVLSTAALSLALLFSALSGIASLWGLVRKGYTHHLAKGVFRALTISGILLIVASYPPIFSGADKLHPHADALSFVVRHWVMPMGWTGGLLLVVAFGVADLIVGLYAFDDNMAFAAEKPPPPGARRSDALGTLQSYKIMLSRGEISQEEYERRKEDILRRLQRRDDP